MKLFFRNTYLTTASEQGELSKNLLTVRNGASEGFSKTFLGNKKGSVKKVLYVVEMRCERGNNILSGGKWMEALD